MCNIGLLSKNLHINAYTVSKIITICHAQDLWNLTGLVDSCVYYAFQTREIYQVLPYSMNFKAPGEFWNPQLESTK